MTIPEPLRDSINALQGITYVRVPNPYKFAKELSQDLRKDLRSHPRPLPWEGVKAIEYLAHQGRKDYDLRVVVFVAVPRDLQDLLLDFSKVRVADILFSHMVILVGSSPATQVVPPELRHAIFPLDLVESLPEPRTVPVERLSQATPEETWEHLYFAVKQLSEPPQEAIDISPLEGLTLTEVDAAIAILTRNSLQKAHRFIDPVAIEAYRTRWDRVP